MRIIKWHVKKYVKNPDEAKTNSDTGENKTEEQPKENTEEKK